MSVQLTMIKTKEEHWMQQIGLQEAYLRLEFSEEHKVENEEGRTIIKIDKKSELYNAFNKNLNDVFKLGVERALKLVLKELSQTRFDKKQSDSFKKAITKELQKETTCIEV